MLAGVADRADPRIDDALGRDAAGFEAAPQRCGHIDMAVGIDDVGAEFVGETLRDIGAYLEVALPDMGADIHVQRIRGSAREVRQPRNRRFDDTRDNAAPARMHHGERARRGRDDHRHAVGETQQG